jgi:hypothetical protein
MLYGGGAHLLEEGAFISFICSPGEEDLEP